MPSLSLLVRETRNWLQHVCEPTRLILAWQAPDQFRDRFRWAVGEIAKEQEDYAFRYVEGQEFEMLNQGKKINDLLRLGYRGYPAFDTRQIRHTHKVLAAFLRRLPPRGRP